MRKRMNNRSGLALVLVLVIVAIITAMVVEFAYGVYVNTSALHNWQTSQQLSIAAKSATRLASKLIADSGVASGNPQDSFMQDLYTKGVFEISQKIPFGDLDGTITLRIENENAKFNLNQLGGTSVLFNRDDDKDPHKMFVRLLGPLNLPSDIADKIEAWVESKKAKLDSIDELLLVPGIDRQTYGKLLPYVTIYGGNQVNINAAGVPVLMSLPRSIGKGDAETIVNYRESYPFRQPKDIDNAGAGNLFQAWSGYITTGGGAFHVVATAESGGIKRIIDSVLHGNLVLYWKEM